MYFIKYYQWLNKGYNLPMVITSNLQQLDTAVLLIIWKVGTSLRHLRILICLFATSIYLWVVENSIYLSVLSHLMTTFL